MFKLFLYSALILVLFVIYNTYFNRVKKLPGLTKINNNDAILYTKSHCPYCVKAKNLLQNLNISYKEVSLENNSKLQESLTDQTGQKTVPYIYINDLFIGGYDQLYQLHKNGKI